MIREVVDGGAPEWAIVTYELVAGMQFGVGLAMMLTSAVALLARVRGSAPRGGRTPDVMAVLALAGLGLWLAAAWQGSQPPPDGQLCVTPTPFLRPVLPQQCEAGWAMQFLSGPLLWLATPTALGLLLRALAIPARRALLYGGLLLGIARGAWLAGTTGLLPDFLVDDSAFDASHHVAAWLAVNPEGFVMGILALGGTGLYHLVLYADLVAGESDHDRRSPPP